MLNHSIFTYFLAQGQNLPLMREIAGPLPDDASFCAGVPFSGGRAMHATGLAVTHYHNGMPFCENGALATAEAPAVSFTQGCLGITATGRLAILIGGAPTHYSRGFPLTADGQICVPISDPPVDVHAFSLGFDQGAFS